MTPDTRTSGSSPNVLLVALVVGAVLVLPLIATPVAADDGPSPTTSDNGTAADPSCAPRPPDADRLPGKGTGDEEPDGDAEGPGGCRTHGRDALTAVPDAEHAEGGDDGEARAEEGSEDGDDERGDVDNRAGTNSSKCDPDERWDRRGGEKDEPDVTAPDDDLDDGPDGAPDPDSEEPDEGDSGVDDRPTDSKDDEEPTSPTPDTSHPPAPEPESAPRSASSAAAELPAAASDSGAEPGTAEPVDARRQADEPRAHLDDGPRSPEQAESAPQSSSAPPGGDAGTPPATATDRSDAVPDELAAALPVLPAPHTASRARGIGAGGMRLVFGPAGAPALLPVLVAGLVAIGLVFQSRLERPVPATTTIHTRRGRRFE